MTMQHIATRVFIYASVVFGITGVLLILIGGPDGDASPLNQILTKILFTTVFIILPSFALSVAGKYLDPRS
ncbi:MAG: hypothetical protein HGA67_02330 [Candidatus Yonathbacteria bacterium]|nr:hypothetical protein [Candidatus Yonathbacteria bacterium]